jgi:VIT1/CCC1 family predicted Fe2+/Mn2+ transporter
MRHTLCRLVAAPTETGPDMPKESNLVPFIVGGGLVIGAILMIALLLLLAGFLTAPFLLVAVVVVASLGILGVSIGAAVLSRRS